MDRKSVAGLLDTAAARAETIDECPATSKQCWYLAGLIVSHDAQDIHSMLLTDTSYVLTKRRASALIDDFT